MKTFLNKFKIKKYTTEQWALWGSIFYEAVQNLHRLALFYLLPFATYGLLGSFLSIVHLTHHLTDLGATNSISPFVKELMSCKTTFRTILWRYTALPHFLFVMIGLPCAAYFWHTRFEDNAPVIIVLLLLKIVSEAIRSFFRQLLYCTGFTKEVVATEVGLLVVRIALLWLLFFGAHVKLTLSFILSMTLYASLACLVFFFYLVKKLEDQLPDTTETIDPSLKIRLIKSRLFNYVLRVSRSFFTSSFLTPLFALTFGLKTAGIFFLASKLAKSIQSVVKITVGYAGNGILARLKHRPLAEKQAAFKKLSFTIAQIVTPALIIFAVNYNLVTRWSSGQSAALTTLALTLLYLILSFSEFYFILYELVYIIEERSGKLLGIKLLEFMIFYFLTITAAQRTPYVLLMGLLVLRAATLSMIALQAYTTWRLVPKIFTGWRSLFAWLFVAGIPQVVLYFYF